MKATAPVNDDIFLVRGSGFGIAIPSSQTPIEVDCTRVNPLSQDWCSGMRCDL
jgi:hypothetical protein